MLIGTLNHVKVKRLKKLIGKPLYCCMGILESIWQLCMECCDDGNIGKFTNEEIADHIEWEGDPDSFINALTESGWLDTCEDHRLVVHDWLSHCPEFIRKRIEKRKLREVKKSKSESPRREIRSYDENLGDMSQESETCLQNLGHVSSISYPIVSHPITSHRKDSSCSEVPSKPRKQPSEFSLGVEHHIWPAFVTTGATSEKQSTWTVTEGDIAEWQRAYPAVDVRQECYRAHAWVKANWKRRKTYTGYPAFFIWWLSKAQDSRPPRGSPDNRPRPAPQPSFDFNEPKTVNVPD